MSARKRKRARYWRPAPTWEGARQIIRRRLPEMLAGELRRALFARELEFVGAFK